MVAEIKICNRCGRELPLSRFSKNKKVKGGYYNQCKDCRNEYQRKYRAGGTNERRKTRKYFYLLEPKTLKIVQRVSNEELCQMLGLSSETGVGNHIEVNGLLIAEE